LSAIPESAPYGRYRRHIEGADFSLEANTGTVPSDGCFYLLRNGEVLLQSSEFPKAIEAYNGLCREFWESRLDSSDVAQRVASAWGLLSLDPEDKQALEIIRQDGSDNDRKRLEQDRNRRRLQKAAAYHSADAPVSRDL
jgi:hypothetical protein